jgi:adenylylsulfate reductase subunit B
MSYMSIQIDGEKCVACAECIKVCPGSLLYLDPQESKAYVKYPQDCWGCTACLKECRAGAIKYYLGADLGGKGTLLHTKLEKELLHWIFVHPNGQEQRITINQKAANKY